MIRIITTLVLVIASSCTWADVIKGKIVKVADGDTVTLLTAENKQVRIRLAQIDAPEKDQPWGQNSKEFLTRIAAGKAAIVDVVQKEDRYKRVVGTIYINGVDICKLQVKMGNAWAYRDYLKDKTIITLEAQAKSSKRGLWSLPTREQMEPWTWRKKAKSKN